MILILAYLYFMVAEWLTANYAAQSHELGISRALVLGDYAAPFWLAVAALVISAGVLFSPNLPLPEFVERPVFVQRSLRLARLTGIASLVVAALMAVQVIPPVRQALAGMPVTAVRLLPWEFLVFLLFTLLFFLPVLRRDAIARGVVCGVLVNLAAVSKRFLIVVPSQTHGTLLPYGEGFYSPTWVEYSIIIALLAMGVLFYTLFVKAFPILEVEKKEQETESSVGAPARPDFVRTGLALTLVVVGFAIQFVAYFFLAAPLGIPTSPVYSDPRLPFAPAVFIAGVMLVFLAAVVYEVLPEKRRA